MNFGDRLRIIESVEEDDASLSLAVIDLRFSDLVEDERAKLREALKVAAVPHWFDETILAGLLDPPLSGEAPELAMRLRQLSIVESFPARGVRGANVHEASRRALRRDLQAHAANRMRVISSRAATIFSGADNVHSQIEALYHTFIVDPDKAAYECAGLYKLWRDNSCEEELLALANALEDILQDQTTTGLLRGNILCDVATIRFYHQPVDLTASQVKEAISHYKESFHQHRRNETEWSLQKAQSLLGDVLRESRDYPAALEAYSAALEISESRAASQPDNLPRQFGLAFALERLGDLHHDQRNFVSALKAYESSVGILKRLANARAHPKHHSWERKLSASYRRMGDLYRDNGDHERSLKAYRDSLAVIEKLSNRSPDYLWSQHDLSAIRQKIAYELREQGQIAGALLELRKSRSILEHLVEREPKNPHWQRDLSTVLGRIAELFRENGDLPAALDACRKSLSITGQLVERDRDNSQWQRDLSISYDILGNVLSNKHDFGGALYAYRASLAIQERLSSQDPMNLERQFEQARACARVAGTLLEAQGGDHQEARRLIDKALGRLDTLASRNPLSPEEEELRESLELLRKNT